MTASSQLGKKIATNSLVAVLAAGVYMVSRIALTPLVLAFVSIEEYGLWGFCFTILGYVAVNGPGVHGAYVKYTAEFAARGEADDLNRLLSTGLLAMTGLCSAIFVGIAVTTPFLLNSFNIDASLLYTAQMLIIGTSAAFLIDAAFSGFYSIACGLQEIAKVRIIWLIVSLVELALILALLYLDWGILSLLYAYIARILIQTAAYIAFAFKRIPKLRVHPSLFCRDQLKTFFTFGGKVQLITLLGMLMITLDKLVATWILGFAAGGLFEIGRKFPMTAGMIVTPVFTPLVPAASHYGGKWINLEETTHRQRRARYLRLFLLSLAVGLLFLAPYPLLTPDYPLVWSGSIVTSSGLILLCLRSWLRSGFARQETLESDDIRQLYLQGARHTILLAVFAFGFLSAISHALIYIWVGEGYAGAANLLLIISIWSVINFLTGAGTQILRGIDRTGRELEYLIVQLTLALLWTPMLTYSFGLSGAALGTLLSTALACVYFLWQTHRCMEIKLKAYLKTCILPTLVPACLAVLTAQVVSLLSFESRWETLGQLAGIGLAYLAINAIVIKAFVLAGLPTIKTLMSFFALSLIALP